MLDNAVHGLQLEIDGREVQFRLIGVFNAYNLLAVYGAAVLLGEDPTEVLTVLSGLTIGAGPLRADRGCSARALRALWTTPTRPMRWKTCCKPSQQIRQPSQQIITVVGCGGNRDAAKRPVMAHLAAKLSDQVVLTSDNPRFEDPKDILSQMQAGVQAHRFRQSPHHSRPARGHPNRRCAGRARRHRAGGRQRPRNLPGNARRAGAI